MLHFGTALKVTKREQLDLHVGVGLSPGEVINFIGIGYSFHNSGEPALARQSGAEHIFG
jgi:hypothetical protein